MADQKVVRVSITARESVALLGSVVEHAATLEGVQAADSTRLHTLTQEVLEAVIRDAYEESDPIDLDLDISHTAGALRITIHDRGAPMELGAGGYPPRVADLVRLGFADGLDLSYQPRLGNQVAITKNLHYASVAADAEFTAAADNEAPEELQVGADGELVVDIRPMTADDVIGVARLFYRTYGYSAAHATVVYEPERLAEYVTAGRHFATVAVTPSGRVVAHLASEIDDPAAVTGRIGLLAVDPHYRRHHLAARVGWEHMTRLVERGIIGQFSEAVTVHLGSQRTALAAGGHEVGLMLAGQRPDIDFRGFQDAQRHRKAVVLFFGSLGGATPAREVYVPRSYVEVVQRIYNSCALPRTIRSDYDRSALAKPGSTSRFTIALGHETRLARLTVEDYGEDFLEALQEQVTQLQLNRFDVILVQFPLSNPGTGTYASGLQELGLSFCGVYPEYHHGDVLVLQNLNNVEFDPAEIKLASEDGEFLRDLVLADYRHAAEHTARVRRSRARMAQIYEVLD